MRLSSIVRAVGRPTIPGEQELPGALLVCRKHRFVEVAQIHLATQQKLARRNDMLSHKAFRRRSPLRRLSSHLALAGALAGGMLSVPLAAQETRPDKDAAEEKES